MRKIMGSSLDYANDATPLHRNDSNGVGRRLWQQIYAQSANPTALGQNINLTHRNVAVESKRQALASIYDKMSDLQKFRVLEGMQDGGAGGFVPLKNGPQTYQDVRGDLQTLKQRLGL